MHGGESSLDGISDIEDLASSGQKKRKVGE